MVYYTYYDPPDQEESAKCLCFDPVILFLQMEPKGSVVETCFTNPRLMILSILSGKTLSDTASLPSVVRSCPVHQPTECALSMPSSHGPLGTKLSLNKLGLLLTVGRGNAHGKLWGTSVRGSIIGFGLLYWVIWGRD